MNTVILSLFAGINFSFALLAFFIWKKNDTDKLYLLFSVFSLFSGFYFLLIVISGLVSANIQWAVLLCAAIYYGIFPWFLFRFIDKKGNSLTWFLSSIFALAILVYLINPENDRYATWQIIAHIGLIGLIFTSIFVLIQFKKNQTKGANDFLFLTVIFTFLALEEIITNYSNIKFLSLYFHTFLPLDIYPLLFTLIIGRRLSNDFYSKNKLKIKLMESELKEKQLQLIELEKKRLLEDIQYKTMDLTNFGIEITKNREFIQTIYHKLDNLKSSKKTEFLDLKEVLKSLKSRLIINKDLNYFNGNVEKINHAFNSKLKKTYPSLTTNEIHLASLLRLNLNTKEIAIIKNISPNSVKVLRYRLRKKLDMNKSNNLSEFLNDIN